MTALEQAQHVALHKIGRNLVNFQRAEAALKFLMAASDFTAPVNELPAALAAALKRMSKMTLGGMRDSLAVTLFATAPSTSLFLLNEARIATNFKVEGLDAQREMQADVDLLTKERNALAHTMLINFNPDSLESCERLSAELDQQLTLTQPALERILGLSAAVRNAYQECVHQLIEQLPAKN